MADRKRPHNETVCEAIVREALKASGIRYSQEVNVKGYLIDFVVGEKVALEVDGYYHASKEVMNRDARKEILLGELGYRLIRISNDEVRSPRSLKKFIASVKEAIADELEFKRKSDIVSTPMNTPAMKELMDKMNLEEQKKKTASSDEELFHKWLDKDPRTSRRK